MNPGRQREIDEQLSLGDISFEEHRRLTEELRQSAKLGQSSGASHSFEPHHSFGPNHPSDKRYGVVLVTMAPSKINTIKVVRLATNRSLKDAKELVESAPALISHGLGRPEALALMRSLIAIGARVGTQPADAALLQEAVASAGPAPKQSGLGCLSSAAILLALLLLASVLPAVAAAWLR